MSNEKTRWQILCEDNAVKTVGIKPVDPVDPFVINFLNENAPKVKGNHFNNKLAGHIQEQYNYKDWPYKLASFIVRQCYSPELLPYHNTIKILKNEYKRHMCLESLWINFQKKYEFNPAHDHSGAFSFIIFLQIPYDINRELKYFPDSSLGSNQTSCLVFTALNAHGKFQDLTIPVDKSFVNKMLVFPATLRHCVYPFYTSDDYRITVSGNIYFGKPNE